MPDLTDEVEDFQARLISKAMNDPSFKEELMSDPRAAISAELDLDLPPDVEVEVLQETEQKVYLVLPIDIEPDEVSDSDLENVAGGIIGDSGMPRPMAVGGFNKLVLRNLKGDLRSRR